MNIKDLISKDNFHHQFMDLMTLEGQVTNSLIEALMKYNKKELLDIIDLLEMDISSVLDQDQICELMLEEYANESMLASIFINLGDQELYLIDSLLEEDQLEGNFKYLPVRFLVTSAFVQMYKSENGYILKMSDEMKNNFNLIDRQALMTLRSAQLSVTEYSKAAMNLYGSLSYEKMKSFYINHMTEIDEGIFDDDILDALFVGQFVKEQSFYLYEGYFLSQFYSEGGEEEGIKLAKNSKPYYRPAYEEFIKYSAFDYSQSTPEDEDMATFIYDHVKADKVKVENFLFGLKDICAFGRMQDAVNDLEDLGYIFESRDDIETFSQLYQALHNNTRMWSNHGFTPKEMGDINSIKVGRNDPCPCGSGKKYKKCCGNPLTLVH